MAKPLVIKQVELRRLRNAAASIDEAGLNGSDNRKPPRLPQPECRLGEDRDSDKVGGVEGGEQDKGHQCRHLCRSTGYRASQGGRQVHSEGRTVLTNPLSCCRVFWRHELRRRVGLRCDDRVLCRTRVELFGVSDLSNVNVATARKIQTIYAAGDSVGATLPPGRSPPPRVPRGA